MPKYRVTIEESVINLYTYEVEAEDKEDAHDKAYAAYGDESTPVDTKPEYSRDYTVLETEALDDAT